MYRNFNNCLINEFLIFLTYIDQFRLNFKPNASLSNLGNSSSNQTNSNSNTISTNTSATPPPPTTTTTSTGTPVPTSTSNNNNNTTTNNTTSGANQFGTLTLASVENVSSNSDETPKQN